VQLLLEEGRWYTTDRLAASAGSTLALGRVLAVKKAGKFSVGTPYVEGAQVEAVVLEDDTLGEKQVVFKFHSKKHYRRKTGHRQPLTKFMVTKIA
jgi:large subunit ribosomal protein L21